MMLSTTIIVQDEKDKTSSKAACPLPAIDYTPTLYSLSDLRKEFVRVLKIHGDRLSAEEMATWLGMEEDDVIDIGDALCVDQSEEHKGQCKDEVDFICKIYRTSKKNYHYALVKRLRHDIEERTKWQSGETLEYAVPKQSSLLSDTIAQEMELTSDDVMRLSHGITTTLVSPLNDHLYLENQVLASLSGHTAPTSLEKLFDDKDLALVIPITRTLCQQGRLPGNVSASSNNVVYTPDVFTHFQRNVIDSFFRTNGYITEKKCVGAGLSRNRMECFVKESFPSAALLAHTVIDPGIICQPLEVAIQSAALNFGYADLRALIPLDVASNNDDVEQVINGCLVDALKLQQDTATYDAFMKGTTIINTDIALFFSHDMSKESVKMLDEEIERYSKQRAKEIVDNKIGMDAFGKKGKPAISPPGSTDTNVISLREVVNCIGNNYPDLKQSQQEYEVGSCESSLSWTSEEVGSCDGPLIEFCRTVLYRDVECKCSRAVRAEVASLESTRHGVSVSNRAVGAAKQMDTQEEFETSFKDLCHLLQIMSKTIENFSARDLFTSEEITSMKRELISGMGSCLARLLTEYCMYRNNVEAARTFAYSHQDNNITSSIGTPAHVSALDFPSFSLQFNPADGGQQNNPLQHLRESLPGSSGLNLVRLWKICSDDYDGDKDGDELLEQFISHLEDSCLTLVGIPFSVLDKKTEKKILAARRQGLIERLEKSSQLDEILSISVILIYQQVKNSMISGKTMTSMVMNRFGQEKKIPTRVTEVLLNLKRENSASPELLHLVKQFGNAKNSKALAAICETSV
mmetsp:Transcript_24032/g.37666  ORF Transcript_24032/g.37666 Transcript_24032/m.37666 type:complete len:803 (+) Transcript_24032:2-2410(+)